MFEVSEEQIYQEKQAARKLRQTRWWQNKIAHGVCFYCGTSLSPSEATMDHILSLAKGGRSTKGNVVVACKACNTKKHSAHFMEWEGLTKL